jgi:hypothetical protein
MRVTEADVERLLGGVKGNGWGRRDAAMLFVAYRHGLRAAELVGRLSLGCSLAQSD